MFLHPLTNFRLILSQEYQLSGSGVNQGRIKGFWGLGLSNSQGPILSPSVEDLLKYVAYIPVLNTFKSHIFKIKTERPILHVQSFRRCHATEPQFLQRCFLLDVL